MQAHIRTLPSVIEDVRVVWIVFDGIVKALECVFGIALFHVYACQLDEALRKSRKECDGVNKVDLGSVDVAGQESSRGSGSWFIEMGCDYVLERTTEV